MGECFLPLARDLGYRASFFNLVFVTNKVKVLLLRGDGNSDDDGVQSCFLL